MTYLNRIICNKIIENKAQKHVKLAANRRRRLTPVLITVIDRVPQCRVIALAPDRTRDPLCHYSRPTETIDLSILHKNEPCITKIEASFICFSDLAVAMV